MNITPSSSARNLKVADAARREYLDYGPSLSYDQIQPAALESIKRRIECAPTAVGRELSGWLAVDLAFMATEHPSVAGSYMIDDLIDQASADFSAAHDMYAENGERPDRPFKVALARAALPLYRSWARQETPAARDLNSYYASLIKLGGNLLALRQSLLMAESPYRRHLAGLAGEMVVQIAYNRRQKSVPSDQLSFVVPSTFRQNAARADRRPGVVAETRRRGNWNLNVVEQRAGVLALKSKLQVETFTPLTQDGKPDTEVWRPYTDDVTVLSIVDTLMPRGLSIGHAPWNLLSNQVLGDAPGANARKRADAVLISQKLYGFLENAGR